MSILTVPVQVDVDAEGRVVLFDKGTGIVYPVTACCGASGKGSANVASGVCCRKCYAEVDPFYGMGWTADDYAASHFCPTCGDLLGACPKSPLHGYGHLYDDRDSE